jgi:hypothetical protein
MAGQEGGRGEEKTEAFAAGPDYQRGVYADSLRL